jgi:hypothetical protein
MYFVLELMIPSFWRTLQARQGCVGIVRCDAIGKVESGLRSVHSWVGRLGQRTKATCVSAFGRVNISVRFL